MAVISIDQAVEKLACAVEGMPADDLVQVYNELFPEEPTTDEEACEDVGPLSAHIAGRVSRGLEPEEVVDLWSVVFPAHRAVYFNEEENLLHFDDTNGTR
jgi:hypothetical protein